MSRGSLVRLIVAAAPNRWLPALLALAALSAGCSLPDWYNSRGTVAVHLEPQAANATALGDFSVLRIAIAGISVKQVRVIDPKTIAYADGPLLVELVSLAESGGRVELARWTQNLRSIEHVSITADVVEAIDGSGRSIPVCREGAPAPSFPCFFLTRSGSVRFEDEPIQLRRGGTVDVAFPLAVQSAVQDGKKEYFLLSEPALS